MKSFTAKEFSRCPAKVYEAAREDGKVEVTHDRFGGCFHLYHVPRPQDIIEDGALIEISQQKLRVIPYKKPPEFEVTNGLELARQAYQAKKNARSLGKFIMDKMCEEFPDTRKKLIDLDLIPPDKLTEEEMQYLRNKKAPD